MSKSLVRGCCSVWVWEMEKAFWAVGKLCAKTGELVTVQTVKVFEEL